MAKLYISTDVEKAIRQYCELNGIKDISAFANKCTLQGLNILKYGSSPIDNVKREEEGERTFKEEEERKATTTTNIRRIKPISRKNV